MKNTMFSFRSQRGYITEVALIIVAVVLASGLMYASNHVSVNYSNSNAVDRSYPVPGGMYPSPSAAYPSPSAAPVPCQNYTGDGEYWLCVGNSVTTNGFSARLDGFPAPDSATFALTPPIWLVVPGLPAGAYKSTYSFKAAGDGTYGYNVLQLQPHTVTAQTKYLFKVKSIDFGDGSFASWRALVWAQTRPYAPQQPTITCVNYSGDGIYHVCANNSVTASDGNTFKVKKLPGQTSGPIAMPAVIETSSGEISVKVGGSVTSGSATLYVMRINYLTIPATLDVCVGSGGNATQCGFTTPSQRR